MKLRFKFILFVFLIHSVLIIISYYLLLENKWLFVLSELLLIISIAISVRLYREFIRPLNLISTGVESIKDQDFNTKFVTVGQSEMDQLIDMYNQMITRLRNERITQQEQHFFLTKLIEASPSGIIILDVHEQVTTLNRVAELILDVKLSDALNKNLAEVAGPVAAELVHLQPGEPKIVYKDGIHAYKCQKAHFVDRGFRHHFLLIEELTEQLLKAEKKAYGKVIRMMSHEINNSIGAINSILNSFLNYRKQLQEEDAEDFENALHVAIERNEKLNHFMTNFADVVRVPPPVRETIDLHDLLQDVNTLMHQECRKRNVDLKMELCEGTFLVNADVQQLEQVLLNILKNSIEAIGDSGQITIQTSDQPQKKLCILDTGQGIPPELQNQLFTPFFSTKKDGQGIGLTMIREILINHDFQFGLTRNAEDLTEFHIIFNDKTTLD